MNYGVIDAFSTVAGHERIAQESGAAETDGTVVAGAVGAWFAHGVGAARIRVAQIT